IDTLPADGTLTLGGKAVVAGQVIAAGDIGSLVFKPDANENGATYAPKTTAGVTASTWMMPLPTVSATWSPTKK
ncbi:MAG TPA: hypothetical protein VMQ93_07090, partial [Novosphingobium sp.]|nr:hypothetical protein [Novosphingobium sp.]